MILTLPTARADEDWQYRLEAGDHLTYVRQAVETSFDGQQPRRKLAERIQLWCLSRDGNEALVLLELDREVDRRPEPTRGLLMHVDDRGRRRLPEGCTVRAFAMRNVLELIPILRMPSQDLKSWATPPNLDGLVRQCALIGRDEDQAGKLRVDYTVHYPTGVGEVLQWKQSGSYWFDPSLGIVTRATSLEEDRTRDLRVESLAELRQQERRPSRWIARRVEESRRYELALRHEDRLLDETVAQPGQIDKTLDGLRRLWAARRDDVEHHADSPFEQLVTARSAQVPLDAPGLRADAQYAAHWLRQPATPWSLQTPAGETLTSEQMRDRPVIECLWSVDEPGFLVTLDAMRKLSEQAGDGRTRVVCLNLDADVRLVRSVLARLPGGLTHVLAGPLRSVDAPPHLPVVRVLDQQGLVRRVWIGWRPSYSEAITEALRWAH